MKERDFSWMRMAYSKAKEFSDNPKTNTGVVIVHPKEGLIGYGSNMFCKGIAYDESKIHPPEVYDWLPHAEKTAIAMVNNRGKNNLLEESTLYSPWIPCSGCAQDITLYNLKEVVMHKNLNDFNASIDDRAWGQDAALEMLKRKGVKYRFIEGKLFEDNFFINFRGKKFSP